jgi:uncharacterized protein YecT (DUF1311 family)
MRALLFAVALLLPSSGHAPAQDAARKSAADACGEAASTYEINACLDKAYTRLDAELNAAYRRLGEAIPRKDFPDPKARQQWLEAMRKTQRAWVAYKEARCNGEVPFQWYGGTGATGASLGCMIAETEKRIAELREQM